MRENMDKDYGYGKLEDLRKILNMCNIIEMDQQCYEDYIINQVVHSLGDSYAIYYTANEMKIVSEEYLYNGFSYYNEGGDWIIENCIPDSEAYRKGLKKGDIIIAINNIPVNGRNNVEINDMLKARPVAISILRENENKLVQLFNEREKCSIPSQFYNHVHFEYQEDWVLVKLLMFEGDVVEKIKKVLQKNRCSNIIFDLRENRGGSVEICLLLLNLILKKGDKICQICQKGRVETEIVEEGTEITKNLYVLVNKNTKSSAEIFATAVKDNGGYVIGCKTYGKGTIQLIYHFDKYDGSCLKLTVAECKTISGEKIEGKGIEPTYYVKNIDSYKKLEDIITLSKEVLNVEKRNAAIMQDSI